MLPVLILLILFPDPTIHVLAQAVPGDLAAWLIGTPVTVLAFITWAWLTGRIHSDKELQRIIEGCDERTKRVEAKMDEAHAELRERNREDRELRETLAKATDLFSRFLDRTPPPPPKGR